MQLATLKTTVSGAVTGIADSRLCICLDPAAKRREIRLLGTAVWHLQYPGILCKPPQVHPWL